MKTRTLPLVLLAGLALSAGAWAQQSPHYQLKVHALNCGGDPKDGATLTSTNYKCAVSSVGDGLAATEMTSPSYEANAGLPATTLSTCTLACTATVPSSGTQGQAVAFASTATATHCSGTPAFDWDFGDGTTHDAAQNPSHTYGSPGTFNWNLTVTAGGATCTQSGTISIACASVGITLSPSSLPNGTVGTAYERTVTAAGGVAPYTFAVTSGSLPSGLSLASGGVLSGTPAAAGAFNFTVTATDTNGCTGAKAYSVTITCASITLSPSSLPNGTVGTAYERTVTAAGGVAPYTFAVTSGSLPSGLSLASGGVLSGTPAAAGAFNFTVTATDANGCTGSTAYGLTITPTGCSALGLSPSTLPVCTVGTAYNQTLTASGGTAPYTFAVTSGSLPAGLALSSGGALSGTASSAGSSSFTVTATDAHGCTGSGAYTLAVVNGPVITLIKKVAPPFKLVVQGSNLQNGIKVYINGVEWPYVTWKKTTKILLTGGKSLKAAVPKGTTHTFRFLNPDQGEATTTWGW